MTSIDLKSLDIEQLPELLAKAQTELASREKQGRTDLRAELERRVAADGYKMADIFPELGAASSSGARRKRPAKYRNAQNPEQAWSGIGRAPKWVPGDPRRTRHRHGRLQVDPDVSDPRLELSQRARGKSGGRRGRIEAVPKRGAAREVARAPEIHLYRGEHPDSTHENRACCEIAPPPGRSVSPRAASNAPSRSASPARGRSEHPPRRSGALPSPTGPGPDQDLTKTAHARPGAPGARAASA